MLIIRGDGTRSLTRQTRVLQTIWTLLQLIPTPCTTTFAFLMHLLMQPDQSFTVTRLPQQCPALALQYKILPDTMHYKRGCVKHIQQTHQQTLTWQRSSVSAETVSHPANGLATHSSHTTRPQQLTASCAQARGSCLLFNNSQRHEETGNTLCANTQVILCFFASLDTPSTLMYCALENARHNTSS